MTIISNGGEHQAPHRKMMLIAGAAAGVLILAAVLAGTAEREEEAILPEPVKVSMNGPSVIVAQEPVEEPEDPWYTEQELAEFVCRNSINTMCDIICGGWCNAVATLKKIC